MIHGPLTIQLDSFFCHPFFRARPSELIFHIYSSYTFASSDHILRRTGFSREGGEKCRAMHLQHFAVGEVKLFEARRWESFILHISHWSNYIARRFWDSLFSEGVVYACGGLAEKVSLQQRSIFRRCEQVSLLFSSCLVIGNICMFGFVFKFRSCPHQAISSYPHRYINLYK